ncbi:methyl-accepting chemotaxis protein [Leptospira ilyithenensis]|uniref:Chemotaxis protein n=1 Tax=Leptospira ilyithenensis TaxID=2484901 RepID=A0A4R9LPD0_9LEPT|nr:methyl-accepting chemotaxis protein [Leptospira ilyithenensis]TGN10861.1 chemotaxis protein [Leptospira ilyithenensis]
MKTKLRFYYFISYFLFGFVLLLGNGLLFHNLLPPSEQSIALPMSLSFAFMTFACMVFAYYSGGSLSNTFTTIENAFREASKGNLQIHIPYKPKELLAEFYENFHRMLQGQSELIQHLRNSVTHLADDSEKMKRVVIEFSSNLQSQSSATEQVSASMEEISGAATSISSFSGENSNSMSNLVDEVEKLSEAMDKTGSNVEGTLASFKQITAKAQAGKSSLQEMNAAMDNLSNSSKEITKMVKTIADVSEQINMLALNAAIEAARAGDSGRGFAVVAEAVSKLAERTASSVKGVNELVKKNQNDMLLGMERIEKTTGQIQEIIGTIDIVSHQMEEVHQASNAQKELRQAVLKEADFVRKRSDEIRYAVSEHNAATNEVVTSVTSITQLSINNSESSDLLTANISGISNTANQLRSMVELFKTLSTTSTATKSKIGSERDSSTHHLEFRSNIGSLYYVKDKNLLEVVWTPDFTEEAYKEILIEGLEVIKKYNISKWMADTRKMGVVTAGAQTWVNEVWFPQAIGCSLRKIAIVIPDSALAAMSIDDSTLKTGNVELKTLPSVETAMEWLLKP